MTTQGRPFVIAVAPNGARRTRADHPTVPLTPDQIAEDARQCTDAGATVLHLHVRDADSRHSLDASRYRAAIAAVQSAINDRMVIQITTEQVGRYTPADQIALLRELRPAAASIAIREIFDGDVKRSDVTSFLRWSQRERIAVQYIVYSAAEAQQLVDMQRAGIVPQQRPAALFVLGRYTEGQQSDPRSILKFLDAWPADWPWSLCAFGATEARCTATAVGLGGHARVGFENNTLRPDGTPSASNAEQVANLARLSPLIGRPLATIEQARLIYSMDHA